MDVPQCDEANPQGPVVVAGHDLGSLFTELYVTSGAHDLELSFWAFAERLVQIARDHAPANLTRDQVIQFYRNLHIDELALALACSKGIPAGWERFLAEYQDRLYATALSIAKNPQTARELTASLSGELFSTAQDAQTSDAKFASYTGRGSLAGWLRAILAHSYVDRYRTQRRTISLEDHPMFLNAIAIDQPAEVPDSRLADAVQEALSACTPKERFLLAAYFFDGKTLAEIAGTMDIHESTASRRLKRLLRILRSDVKRSLRRKGMTEKQIMESFESDLRTLSFDLSSHLFQSTSSGRE